MSNEMVVGVLGLQGCIDHHIGHFTALGVMSRRVRYTADLEGLDRIVLPGGESTTMLKLLHQIGLWQPLKEFGRSHPVWGICAGAILMAKEVLNPEQESLGLVDICARRNFYGSQLDSFKAEVQIEVLEKTIKVDFIRAPLLEPKSPEVIVMANYQDRPVLMQQGRLLVSAFHTELGEEDALHRYFLEL